MQVQWQRWKRGLLTVSVGFALMFAGNAFAAKSAPNTPLPLDELRIFSAVFDMIKQEYVEQVTDKSLLEGALKGMVSHLDPHSAYFDQKAYQDFLHEFHGEFGGLGIEIMSEHGLIKVISPIDDTPAYRAGIKSGDLIVKIDEEPVQQMSLTEALSKMRGKPNTSVTLTIIRKSEFKPLVFTLRRAMIKVQSVKAYMLESNYGYIRVTHFQEKTLDSTVAAVHKLLKDNRNLPLKGLVIDLRNNPGGSIQPAVGIPAIFLPRKTLVVYTEGRTDAAKTKLYADPLDYLPPEGFTKTSSVNEYAKEADKLDPLKALPAWLKTVPMVVLVNAGSASASEIVAGALQDHRRALIVGTQTFGKGSVQVVVPIDGGKAALRLTTSRYFTPNGHAIQAKGLTPDIVVEEAVVNKEAVNNALQFREGDLQHHLETVPSAGSANTRLYPQVPGDVAANMARDYQLQQGLNVLKVQRLLLDKQSVDAAQSGANAAVVEK